jgi:hypothetical protein
VKAIASRLLRLEDEFGPADGKPRERFRMVVSRLDRKPGLEGATTASYLNPAHSTT